MSTPPTIRVTSHAEARIRERLGVPKRAIKSLALKAWLYGYSPEETTGDIRRYFSSIVFPDGVSNPRLYGYWVFMFSTHNLVTVIALPRELYGAAAKLLKRGKLVDDPNHG